MGSKGQPKGSKGQPEGAEGQWKGSGGQLEGSEGQPERLRGQLGGLEGQLEEGWMNGQIDKWTDKPILQDSVPSLAISSKKELLLGLAI